MVHSQASPFPRRKGAPLVAAALASLVCLASFATSARAQKLDVQYDGSQPDAYNGWSVSSGFDCDGDGRDDLAIGSPGVGNIGVVNVYSGATHALLNTFFVNNSFAYGGYAAALVGDMDGDGFGDVVIGAPYYNGSDGYAAAYSVKSGALLWEIYGATGEQLGKAIAAAGDVDHDGHMDVLVGAPGGDNVYLFGWNTGALHVWHGTQGNATFGTAVSGDVDVDGDGTLDVIIGEPSFTFSFRGVTIPYCGRVLVYSGANYVQIWEAWGDSQSDILGQSVCGLGDVNGDGRAEVLAGAPYANNSTGYVRKFSGTGAKLADLVGSTTFDQFGFSLDRIPDVDGDGKAEFAIGAPQDLNGWVELRKGDDDTLLWTFTPPNSSDYNYGYSVAGGDLDGDGRGDVVVGDPIIDVGAWVSAGEVDVWLTKAATATNYGTGFPGTLGIPALSALGNPGIGETFVAGITNSRGSPTTALVLLGFSRLNVLTHAGGTLLVAPFEVIPLPLPATGALLSGAIPNDPTLLGIVIDLQVLELDPGAAHKLSFTNGLELQIGVDYP